MASIQKIHARLIVLGLEKNAPSMAKLLSSCALSSGDLNYAYQIFKRIERPPAFIWNIMIRAWAQSNNPQVAIDFYNQMKQMFVQPDKYTFPFTLKACSRLLDIVEGRKIHGHAVKLGLSPFDVFVQNALIHTYSLGKNILHARQLFEEMSERDLVSWNSLIAGYSENGQVREILFLFQKMQDQNITGDEITMAKVISACMHLGEFDAARSMVDYIENNSVKLDLYLCNVLIDMYGRCGSVDAAYKVFLGMSESNIVSWNAMLTAYAKAGNTTAARRLFDEMPERDLISWTSMISGYSQASQFSKALALFRQMQLANVKPDEITLVSVLSACAHLGALDHGKWIHNYIQENRIKSDVYVGNALINMYCKCGSPERAMNVFREMLDKDTLSWNSIILGLAVNGHAEDALQLFPQMIEDACHPNEVTFLGVLLACSHKGLVDQGYEYFERMTKDYHLLPTMKHYGCMADLLSRSGRLDEAYELIMRMPFTPDPVLWRTLLSACVVHGNVKLAEIATRRLLVLEADNGGTYVLLANVYARVNRWSDATRIREKMRETDLEKTPGCSSIEVNWVAREFVATDWIWSPTGCQVFDV